LDIPDVVCLGIAWEKDTVSSSNISSFTKLLKTKDVQLQQMFRGLNNDLRANLIGVIGYYGKHYVALTYEKNIGWLLLDDTIIKRVPDLLALIKSWKLQPALLFYEITNLEKPSKVIPKLETNTTNSDFAQQKRRTIRESIILETAIAKIIEDRLPEKPIDKVPSPQVPADLTNQNGADHTVAQSTDVFGFVLEGNSPVFSSSIYRNTSQHENIEYYHCGVKLCPPQADCGPLQYRSLKLCVFLKSDLKVDESSVVIVAIKFSGHKSMEMAELNNTTRSAFLDLPFTLHSNQDFELQFQRRFQIKHF
jgi:hypothetical protein